MMGNMTIQPETGGGGAVLEMELCDRLDRSLRHSGLSVGQMADALGMSVASVGRWLNGRGMPKRAAILAWAAITDVEPHWLEKGHAASTHVTLQELRACRDSNPKPSDLYSGVILLRLPGDPRTVKPTLTPNRPRPISPARHLRSVS